MITLYDEAKSVQKVFGCTFERALVMASERNPELTEPVAVPKKKVYQVDRTGMPGEGDQSKHAPAVSPTKAKEPEIWDPEVRAQKLASYAYAIKREKPGWDFTRCWNQAVAEHPELIGTEGGMSKSVKVPATNVLPGTNAVTASYTEIGFIK